MFLLNDERLVGAEVQRDLHVLGHKTLNANVQPRQATGWVNHVLVFTSIRYDYWYKEVLPQLYRVFFKNQDSAVTP